MNSSSHEIREFLLDRLPPERAEAIEERMFQDEAYFSDLQDAEDELIEEYATDALDPADEKAFSARIESSPVLQERVALRRALIRTLQARPPEAVAAIAAAAPPARRRMGNWFLIPGFALAIVLLFFIAYTADHRIHLPSQATGTARPAPASANSGQTAAVQAAAVLFLPAHVARGSAQRASVLHIGSASRVKLELETPSADASTRWTVSITSGSASVFSSEGLVSQQAGVVSYVVAEVPASQLSPKIYAITLSSGGAVSSSWELRVVP